MKAYGGRLGPRELPDGVAEQTKNTPIRYMIRAMVDVIPDGIASGEPVNQPLQRGGYVCKLQRHSIDRAYLPNLRLSFHGWE